MSSDDTTTIVVKKTSIFDVYATDAASEENGKWFDSFGPNARLKLRRFSSKKSQTVRTALEKPFAKISRGGVLPEHAQEEIFLRHLSEGVVVDWEGDAWSDREGNQLPFSAANAYTLFKALPDFAREVLLTSMNMDNFREESKVTVTGNS